ncbi:glycosyl transferase, family 1 protein [Pasteurella multocida]|uniref:Glycosyltransferase, group 1 family protein n=1 Tax=Pasteurella dagmatis ATCC 43325 TaxID=667128 RepID=C9PS79_9PAST|nr:glycosyltransferase family 4 protein [Pasteurella dagmatis]EEX49806.1 glycosyltransferase, group 1 family protein [Pasteurella dagmatis ATCC 43325]SNV71592.1 glycosyl transferase, family 1 protein [Pasteurella dagmatis]VEI57228.1 glycosyl transferase, family 1 protein [Pasteurella multocida]
MEKMTLSELKPMYIGYVLKRYPRFSETFVVNEILAHERAGTKIDIFALGPVMETHFQDGISQVRAPVSRLTDKQRNTETFWALLNEGFSKLSNFAAKLEKAKGTVHEVAQSVLLALEIKKRGIQHLHAHFGTQATTVARQAAIFADITYTFTAHAKDIYFQYEESTELGQKMRDASATVTVSDYNLAYLREQYGDDAKSAVRIYNGMDLRKFPYQPFTQNNRHILSVGRLVAKKGFSVLLDALAILKQREVSMHCTLVGDGGLRGQLLEQIERLNIQDVVDMVGPMPQPEIIKFMKSANMMIAPSVISEDGDRDGLPTVLLESMALGTPVISTQVAGIPELVQDGVTGLCVPPNDPEALADAIERLLDDPELCKTLSLNSRALIESEYDEDKNVAVLQQLFSAAINK